MQLPKGTIVAVTDGKQLHVFRNGGDETTPQLAPLSDPTVSTENKGSGGRHHSSPANPDSSRVEEDSFAAGTAEYLNKLALSGKIDHIVVVAAPKTLGELRKHYHKSVSGKLLAELSKDLTGHSGEEIAKALADYK